MLIVAHRGAAGIAPENTLASFKEAIRLGADWLEFDVRLTGDGVPVVIHDPTLKRTTTGKGTVRSRTLGEIRRLDAGSWFDSRYSGEKVPTLDEVIKLAPKARLNVEIKSNCAPASEAAKAVWERVQDASLQDRALITSFDIEILKAVRELAPQAPLGFPWQSGLRDPVRRALSLKARMMLFEVGGLSEKKVRRCREVGLDVWVYTVNEPEEMRRVMDLGVDALVTDRPDLLARLVRRESSPQ